jgi:methyltransferase (TIGR00027 family)
VLEKIIREAGHDTAAYRFLKTAAGRFTATAIEGFLLEGIQLHYAARKRWIERNVRAALESGAARLLVIGAGFDLLAWRLAGEYPDLEFYEIDHPATQRPKAAILKGRGNFHLLPADLSKTSITSALAGHEGFRRGGSTVSVAEGLTMYLEEEKVAALLGELAALAGGHGGVIFTFMKKSADGSIRFRNENRAISWWLEKRSEPFRWGINFGDLPQFLQRCGLEAGALADHENLTEEILAPFGLGHHTLAQGECLCRSNPIPPHE